MSATTCEQCQATPGFHAGLHVGHVWTETRCPAYRTSNGADCTCNDDDECAGECITRPHLWTLGGAGMCSRTGCRTLGTGDPCGDGDCWGDGECLYCDRRIVRRRDGVWLDPDATGDDLIWSESCDANDTFTAEHEPKP